MKCYACNHELNGGFDEKGELKCPACGMIHHEYCRVCKKARLDEGEEMAHGICLACQQKEMEEKEEEIENQSIESNYDKSLIQEILNQEPPELETEEFEDLEEFEPHEVFEDDF